MLSRRNFISAALATPVLLGNAEPAPDYKIEIAPCSLELGPRKSVHTVAYNGQAPGPLLRFQEGTPVTVEVTNNTKLNEVVHWHGLFLPSSIDGAMEEGTPAIPPGQVTRYNFTPKPSGFRWYHTHTFAGRDMNKGQYTGQHGCLFIEPRNNLGRFDAEIFLALHDWRGELLASGDGSMNPSYEISTVNGRVLGFGEPVRVKSGQRILFHVLNSSPTETHSMALAGHQFQVTALDGNAVPSPKSVSVLRLAPAERVSGIVEMNNPGVWIFGEVRKHIQAAGMGIVIEYADKTGDPQWLQPEELSWNYFDFAAPAPHVPDARPLIDIPLVFKSKFTGHGDLDHWTINGKSYPHTDPVTLQNGQRYCLQFHNESTDDHPVHLHRHLFELRSSSGIMKDTVLVDANTRMDVEFTANDPGPTLFHCHQQDHMDTGFMMLFKYA